jgi:hypothetical protein
MSPRLRPHFRIIKLTAAPTYEAGPKEIEGRLTYLKLEYVTSLGNSLIYFRIFFILNPQKIKFRVHYNSSLLRILPYDI